MYPSGQYGAYGNTGVYAAPYGTLELAEASPVQSFVEPLSLDEVGEFLQLPETMVQAQGATLLGLISAAREQAEIAQGRDLVVKQWDLVLDYWPFNWIELRPKLISVDLVQYRDSTGAITVLTAGTDFLVDATKQPGVLTPLYNSLWPTFTPSPTGSILIRFRAGMSPDSAFWSDAGARVKVGMKQLIVEWFSNRIPIGTKCEEFPYGISSSLSHGGRKLVR